MSTFSASATFSAIDKITAPIKRMAATTQAFANSASTSFNKVAEHSKNLTGKIEGLSSKMISLKGLLMGTAMFGAGKFLYDMAKKSMELNTEQVRLAERLGMSIQGMKELSFVAKMSDMSLESFSKSFGRFSKVIGDVKTGTGKLNSFLLANDRVLLKQLRQVKTNEQAFMLFAGAASRIKDPMIRATFVQQAFGKGAANINNLLMKGPKGIEALREEYRKLAGTNGNAAISFEKMEEAEKRMTTSLTALKTSIGISVTPVIVSVMERTTEWLATNRQMLKENITGYINMFAKALFFLLKHLNIILPLIIGYVGVLGALKIASMTITMVTWAMQAASLASSAAMAVSYITTGTLTEGLLANATALGIVSFWEGIVTAATWAFSAALWSTGIPEIIIAIVALVAGIVLLVKHWKEITEWVQNSNSIWAKLIRVVMFPLVIIFKSVKAAIVGLIDGFKGLISWVTTSDSWFAKIIRTVWKFLPVVFIFNHFKQILHGVVTVIKTVWDWLVRIAKIALAPVMAVINAFSGATQKELGVNVTNTVKNSEKPVNKDASILTQKKILETTQRQNVQINIGDDTGRATVKGALQPIPINIRNTKGGFGGFANQ